MQQVPECPRCGVEVQPHWDRCEACGYSHHDDGPDLAPPPTAPPGFFDAPAPGAAGAAGLVGAAGLAVPPRPDLLADGPPPPPPPPPVEPPSPAAAEVLAGAPPVPGPPDAPPSETPPPFDPTSFVQAPFDEVPLDAPPSSFAPSSNPDPSPPPPPPPPGNPVAADPLAQWEHQASPSAGPPAVTGAVDDRAAGTGEAGAPEPGRRRRAPKRVTAAEGARSTSSFELNKVVVAAAVVLAVLVLGWQGYALLKTEEVPVATGPPGSTIPPLGAIAPTTTPLTTPDGVTIPPPSTVTTTTSRARPCDSISSIYSNDGKGYTPCDAGFQVDLPGRADIRSSVAETALGPVTWYSLTSTDSGKDPWVRSVVVYGLLPREVAPEEVAGVQEALVSQLLAAPGAPTTFQDQPALTFEGVGTNGEQIEGIAFVSGTRAFALATRSPGSPSEALDDLERSFVFL